MTGSRGVDGPVTVGPTGPSGPAGVAGARGTTGDAGAKGSTELGGIAGPAGATGIAGAQGAMGATGTQGPLAGGGTWSSFRDYAFSPDSDDIVDSDSTKAGEIADYMNENPSYRIGIDGANERRVGNVRSALIDAGVPASRITTGAFGDPELRNDGRVAVLIRS